MGGQTMVVGIDSCKFFDFRYPWYCLDFRDNNLLFFLNWCWGLLCFGINVDDELVLVDLDFVKCLFGVDEFEGFTPIELLSSMGTHTIK